MTTEPGVDGDLAAQLRDARAEAAVQDRRISELYGRLRETRAEITAWRDSYNQAVTERDDARAENERLTIRVETQEQLYDELRDELAAERAKVAAGIETEKSSNATARKIIADLRAKLAAAEQERDEACESANHANASADHFRHHADRAEAALAAMRELLNDLAGHGLRCDLQPTVMFGDESHVYRQLTDYLRRLDSGLRERARTALAAAEQPEPERTERDEVIANFQCGAKSVYTTRGLVTSVEQYDAATEQSEPKPCVHAVCSCTTGALPRCPEPTPEQS